MNCFIDTTIHITDTVFFIFSKLITNRTKTFIVIHITGVIASFSKSLTIIFFWIRYMRNKCIHQKTFKNVWTSMKEKQLLKKSSFLNPYFHCTKVFLNIRFQEVPVLKQVVLSLFKENPLKH